jgi:hypothetical protein
LGAFNALHEIAVQRGIVTLCSSMLVLVNDAQKQRLAEAEKRGDRFERELEQVGETVPEGYQTVAEAPEPEEWLLIAVAAGLLGWYVWRRRFTPGSRSV